MPKQVGLGQTFFRHPDLDYYSVKKSPHNSNSLGRESISKLPGGMSLFVGLQGTIKYALQKCISMSPLKDYFIILRQGC